MHVKQLQAKMVPFAEYEMPVEYREVAGGVLKEHMHTRTSASLFDVSHMGQLKIRGKDRLEFLNPLVVADLPEQRNGTAVLSLLTNEKGGIIDDTIITKFPDYFFMVVNAGCKVKDLIHLEHRLALAQQEGKDVQIDVLSDRSLLAVQGPKAAAIVQKIVKDVDLSKVKFMTASWGKVNLLGSIEVLLSRCGYTGEDGFEISVPNDSAVKLADLLLTVSEGVLKPAGLGARDSLRLESGLCLYGHELTEEISPVEASLVWTIGASKKKSGNFLGGELTLDHLSNGTRQRRIGFTVPEGPSAREGVKILSDAGNWIGRVTSGTFSPVLKHAVGMGYVKPEFSKAGTPLFLEIRGKRVPAVISKLPFVPTKYYK